MQFLIVIKRITAVIFISLYLFSCNTIEPPPLPKYQSIDESPAWSPDGKWIAYYHFNSNPDDSLYPTGLYIIDTSGSNRRLIIAGHARNPDWSPDGKKIAFSSGDIFTISPNGNELTRITNVGSAFSPSWSPDGMSIVYDVTSGEGKGLWIINLITNSNKHLGLGRDADWSPNGEKLVYEGPPGSTRSESQLWVVDTSGMGNVQLTSNNSIINRSPSWSPDGSTIAWTTDHGIWLMNADGTNQRELINDYSSSPSWSPDSRKIAFQNLNPEKNKIVIWIINIDGSGLKQITY
jgi:Tol biopolymer transport system component